MKRKERIPDAIYERGYVYNFHFHLIWVTKYRNCFKHQARAGDEGHILLRIAQLNDVTVEETGRYARACAHAHQLQAKVYADKHRPGTQRRQCQTVPQKHPGSSTINSGAVISGHAATI